MTMLTRYYDTMRTPTLDLFDPFKIFADFERPLQRHRSDTIDDEGIKIEMPGVKPSDVDVTVEGRTLKVSGKSRHGVDFSYAYTLKSLVDETAVTAKLEDGLLSIVLPKKQEAQSRKIPVTS